MVIQDLRCYYLEISSPVQPRMGYMNPLVTVIEGEDVELNCQAVIGNPRPKVLWLQNEAILRTDGHIKKNSNGNLVIKDIQPFHDGDYICLGTNVGGNDSIIVTVDVQGKKCLSTPLYSDGFSHTY